jgi:site-specific DNA recombinase
LGIYERDLGVFAEFERETIIDRVTSGMSTKAAKGKWAGGKLPYGYGLDPETHKLAPNAAEAIHIAEIFRLYTRERLGTRNIATILNGKGITTRSAERRITHRATTSPRGRSLCLLAKPNVLRFA